MEVQCLSLNLQFLKLGIEFMLESVFYIAILDTKNTLPGLIEVLVKLLEADLRLLTEVQETATTPPHVRLHWMKNRSQWSKQ